MITRSDIAASVCLDHKADDLFIDLKSTPRGYGYWKLNTSLLDDQNYINLIEKVITNYLNENSKGYTNPHVRWEALKCVIRGETIAYSMTKQKRLRSLQKTWKHKF